MNWVTLVANTEPVVRLTPQARIIAAVIAIGFMIGILDLIRREKLTERYSIVWFVLGLAMLAGAAFPGLLQLLAELLGVRDATIALFSLLILILLGLALNFSVIASRQSKQITRLAQRAAIESIDGDEGIPPAKLERREIPDQEVSIGGGSESGDDGAAE